jgi:hypothetical protein
LSGVFVRFRTPLHPQFIDELSASPGSDMHAFPDDGGTAAGSMATRPPLAFSQASDNLGRATTDAERPASRAYRTIKIDPLLPRFTSWRENPSPPDDGHRAIPPPIEFVDRPVIS